jgi:hypothetical protein
MDNKLQFIKKKILSYKISKTWDKNTDPKNYNLIYNDIVNIWNMEDIHLNELILCILDPENIEKIYVYNVDTNIYHARIINITKNKINIIKNHLNYSLNEEENKVAFNIKSRRRIELEFSNCFDFKNALKL